MSEPLNCILLVLAGAFLGAVAAGCWWCIPRWRWRRQWRALAERNGRDFTECGHTARFLAQSAQLRTEQRARQLARLAGTEAVR